MRASQYGVTKWWLALSSRPEGAGVVKRKSFDDVPRKWRASGVLYWCSDAVDSLHGQDVNKLADTGNPTSALFARLKSDRSSDALGALTP